MHSWEQFYSRFLALAFEPGDSVKVTEFLKALVRRPTVRMNRAAGSYRLLDESVQAGCRAICHSRKADTADAGPIFFRRDCDERLSQPITSSPGTDAANESFVHFDRSTEPIPSWADHRPAQLVQPTPSRFVTAET